MGCGFSDQDWQAQLEAEEQAIFRTAKGIDMNKLVSKYTRMQVRGQWLSVRTHIYNDNKELPTLLMTHGYAMAAVYYVCLLPELSKHYRIVMFDNLSWGLNSRTDDVSDALESPQKAEEYLVEWFHTLITTLGDELPPKFFMSAHSLGGGQTMNYICRHPERISGMFFQSPACAEDITDPNWVYDPYTVRLGDESPAYPSKKEVDEGIEDYAHNVHIQKAMHKVPYFMMKSACKKNWRKMTRRDFLSEECADHCGQYYALMTQRWSDMDVVAAKMLKWFCFQEIPFHTADRMLQDFDFPIAFVNGTRDFFGSAEGSNKIVENNRFYKDGSGRSQIFKLKNSGHNVFLDNPGDLTEMMIGFFNGTVTHKFDLKPRQEFVADVDETPGNEMK